MSVLKSNDSVKARKPHRCDLCGETIEKGLIHHTRSGVGDDGFYTMRAHLECYAHEQETMRGSDDWYFDTSEPAFERPKLTTHD